MKTAAPKTVTDGRCGRWANVHATMPAPSRRRWARALFAEALPAAQSFRSPRASAFTLLGLDAYCAVVPDDRHAQRHPSYPCRQADVRLTSVETSDWLWFEESLAYDNARLPQALIVTGMATQHTRLCRCRAEIPALADAATNDVDGPFPSRRHGQFRRTAAAPRAFDQQPLEATATIAACLAAWRADDDAEWKTIATRVFSWFLGSNDLSVALVDPETGSCRDGLHPDRANENRGGESVVSYLLASLRSVSLRASTSAPTHPVALRAIGA